MKGQQILIEPRAEGGAVAALLIDGRLEDFLIDPLPHDTTPRPEAIYRAVAARPMKGVGGVIVDLGGGVTGFLRTARPPAPGTRLLVQVATWADPGKAPPVSARLTLKGAFAIVTPGAPGLNLSRAIPDGPARAELNAIAQESMAGAPQNLGLILRSLAASAEAEAIRAEISELRAQWAALADAEQSGAPSLLSPASGASAIARREWRSHPDDRIIEGPNVLAESGVWDMAADLLRPGTPLGSGSLTVEATRALVAVDVNTGGDLSPAGALKTNLAAARELPRQLRLRGLGGQITIDFAPLAKKDRPRIEAALKAALRFDGIETTIAGWTPLGCLELLRKRARRSLRDSPLR